MKYRKLHSNETTKNALAILNKPLPIEQFAHICEIPNIFPNLVQAVAPEDAIQEDMKKSSVRWWNYIQFHLRSGLEILETTLATCKMCTLTFNIFVVWSHVAETIICLPYCTLFVHLPMRSYTLYRPTALNPPLYPKHFPNYNSAPSLANTSPIGAPATKLFAKH